MPVAIMINDCGILCGHLANMVVVVVVMVVVVVAAVLVLVLVLVVVVVVVAVEVRDQILRAASKYRPREASAMTSKPILLSSVLKGEQHQSWPPFVRFPAGRRRILVMGLYHSCTNAMVKELENRFDVEVLNDWHTGKADLAWKHRANRHRLEALSEDVFCILLVKEPHFWLRSCSRELRNFFELRPFEGPQRREMPAQKLSQLLGTLEHDCLAYENALHLWNDTVRSYMDDQVYPADQAVIVRCEDFLFSFHDVMAALAQSTPRSCYELHTCLMGHTNLKADQHESSLMFRWQPVSTEG
eukprot:s960_g10.t1